MAEHAGHASDTPTFLGHAPWTRQRPAVPCGTTGSHRRVFRPPPSHHTLLCCHWTLQQSITKKFTTGRESAEHGSYLEVDSCWVWLSLCPNR